MYPAEVTSSGLYKIIIAQIHKKVLGIVAAFRFDYNNQIEKRVSKSRGSFTFVYKGYPNQEMCTSAALLRRLSLLRLHR